MKYWFWIMALFVLSGCGALDDSDDDGDDTIVSTSETLEGLWIGKTSEYAADATTATEFDTVVMFNEQTVYILRADEAQIGTYEIIGNGASDWSIELYPYANPDTTNNFFVGVRNNERFLVDALFSTETRLVLNYDNIARNGTVVLDQDLAQESSIDLARVQGEWTTTDSVMYVNQEGGFQGSIQGCQWEGNFARKTNLLLALTMVRRNCDEFNPSSNRPAEGLATIDGEGNLHLMVQQDNSFLWMKFAASAATPTPDGEADAPAEEADPAAEENPAAA